MRLRSRSVAPRLSMLLLVLVVATGCTTAPHRSMARRERTQPRTASLSPPSAMLDARGVVISAHRGGAGQSPQNSLLAYRRGLAAGYDELEADVWLTVDRQPIIYHDATISSSRCHGRYSGRDVWTLTAAQIATIRCQGQPIPSLRQLVDLVARSRHRGIGLRLETKAYPGQRPASVKAWARRVAEQVAAEGLVARTVFEAFNWTSFAGYREVSSTLRLSALTTRPTRVAIAEAARLRAYDFSYDADFSTRAANASIAAAKLVPTAWNVDAVPPVPRAPSPTLRRIVLARFGRLACDGIRVFITNYPQFLEQVRDTSLSCAR